MEKYKMKQVKTVVPAASAVSKALQGLTVTSLTTFVGVDAGDAGAAHDARFAAVTTAYYHALTGQKTQLLDLRAACEVRNTPKKCRTIDATLTAPASAKMAKVYVAYEQALLQCGIPGLVKGMDTDARMVEASRIAGEFVMTVEMLTAPAPKKAKTAPVVTAPDSASAETKDAAAASDDSDDAVTPATIAIDVGMALDAVCGALGSGMLSGVEIAVLRAALAAHDSAVSAPVLMVA